MLKNSETNEKIARSFNEHNDCNVRAMANALGMNYRQAHAYHKKQGRKNRGGTSGSVVKQFAEDYAKRAFIVKNKYNSFIPDIPKVTGEDLPKTVNQFTKDKRFSKGRFVVYVSGHAVAVVDGKTQDFVNENGRNRVVFFIEV